MTRSLLDEALDGWRYAREGVIAELENIPETSWTFRPVPGTRSVAELARHIVESGLMMAGELSRPDGDFTRQSFPSFMAEYASGLERYADRAALLALLRRSHEDGDRQIRTAGERVMLSAIRQFDGTTAARLSWMSHGIAHEEYHRGQFAVYARLLGLVPALTKTMIAGS
jgi:uncharacterized damage-inducible protein DinB